MTMVGIGASLCIGMAVLLPNERRLAACLSKLEDLSNSDGGFESLDCEVGYGYLVAG